jgi:hypothetical protein
LPASSNEHDHRAACDARAVHDFPQRVRGKVRHVHVEQDQVGTILQDGGDCARRAVANEHTEARELERGTRHLEHDRVVVYDEDRAHVDESGRSARDLMTGPKIY